jgi:TolB-like protein
LAEPGGICVSGKVAREVEKKLAFGFEPMGEQKVKNITRPVQAFRVIIEGQARRQPVIPFQRRWVRAGTAVFALLLVLAGAAWTFWPIATVSGKHSVAVLPFDNYGGDEATGRLADGLTEDIITDLARFPEFKVIARNSTETYKGKAIDVREIGKALDVGFVVEGSIAREADRVRVTAQLIGSETGRHLWSQRWDRPDKEVFVIQTQIVEGRKRKSFPLMPAIRQVLSLGLTAWRLVNSPSQANSGEITSPLWPGAVSPVLSKGIEEQPYRSQPHYGRNGSADLIKNVH